MALNPNHRPKLEEIIAHPWMQGEFATPAQIQVEFKRRKDIVDEEAKTEREEKRQQRAQEANARVRRAGVMQSEDETEYMEMQNQLKQQFQDYGINDYDAEIWKKTSFFTSGDRVDLFMEIIDHLETLGISKSVSDSVFKIKFDATPQQSEMVLSHYILKLNELAKTAKGEKMLTQAQRAILKSEKAAKIIAGQAAQEETKEESKEESKEAAAPATCVVEIMAVRQDSGSQTGEEGGEKIIAHCVSFSYKDKSPKKLDLEKSYLSHFQAWKTLLNAWVNLKADLQ